MRRRKPNQAPLLPTVAPVVLSAREREAWRRLSAQRGTNLPLGYDPLELRLGLRTLCRFNRPYYVISNPAYDETLRRNPGLDDSLPGVAWLRSVYGRNFRLLTLPSARAVIASRTAQFELEQRAMFQRTRRPAADPQQMELFLASRDSEEAGKR